MLNALFCHNQVMLRSLPLNLEPRNILIISTYELYKSLIQK